MSLKVIYQRIPSYLRVTFLAAIIFGVITHLYMLTNKLPNHDDITVLYGRGATTSSGRWLLHTVLGFSGDFSTPVLNGVLSVFWLSAASCITVELLRIRRPLFCGITALLMVAFPTVTSTLTYMFTADGYFLALAMACFAMLCAVRFRWGWIPAVLVLAMSMGIYQSYFSVAAVLGVGVLILECLDNTNSPKQLIGRCLRLLFVLLGGLLLYMGIVRITAQFVTLSDYMGISEMGQLSFSQLPTLIIGAYKRYFYFFVSGTDCMNPMWLRYFISICAVITLAVLAWVSLKRRLPKWRMGLLVVLIALYPLAGNIITVMAPKQSPHMLMLYGLCYLPIMMLMTMEYATPHWNPTSWVRRICIVAVAITVSMQAFQYVVIANQAYLKMDIAGKQLESYSTRLLSAIERVPGYETGMPVVFAGHPAAAAGQDTVSEFQSIQLVGVFSLKDYLYAYSYPTYLRRYHGFNGKIYSASSEVTKSFLQLPEVTEMPPYPSEGSVCVIDGHVVVKFSY